MHYLRFSAFSILLGTIVACTPEATDEASAQGAEVNDRADLFDKSEPLEMTVSLPLTTLFTRFKAGQADPPAADAKPGAEAEYSEPATFIVSDADGKGTKKTVEGRIAIRGESSRGDCPFPKLKMKFENKDQLKGTILKGHGTTRINTHCGPGDANARSGMGRVQNGVGPVREELTYRLIRASGVQTYLTRVSKISYKDTAGDLSVDTFAMLFESGDDAAQRLIKAKLIEPEAEYLDPKTLGWNVATQPDNLARITVAEAFAGNSDWGGTHNVDTFGVPNSNKYFQIPQDFDLTSITVAGGGKANWWGAPIENANGGLQDAAIVAEFASHKADMIAAFEKAQAEGIAAGILPSKDKKTTDDPGFVVARKRIDDFYALPALVNAKPGK